MLILHKHAHAHVHTNALMLSLDAYMCIYAYVD